MYQLDVVVFGRVLGKSFQRVPRSPLGPGLEPEATRGVVLHVALDGLLVVPVEFEAHFVRGCVGVGCVAHKVDGFLELNVQGSHGFI